MNQKELISIIRTEILLAKSIPERKGYIAGLEEAISIIEGFSDEPQKTVVPQFVADFITEQKKHGLTLSYSIDASMSGGVAEWYWDNPELFVRAWLDGYEIEQEKRYQVSIAATGQCLGKYYINNEILSPKFIYTGRNADYFTRKELEEAGFAWVFDCPGIEVEGR